MNDGAAFILILLLGAIGTWLYFYEAKANAWALSILRALGCLILFSLLLRLVMVSGSRPRLLALLLVSAGFLITRNLLGLRHWRKTGDRTGLWSTIGLDALVIVLVLAGLYFGKFR